MEAQLQEISVKLDSGIHLHFNVDEEEEPSGSGSEDDPIVLD